MAADDDDQNLLPSIVERVALPVRVPSPPSSNILCFHGVCLRPQPGVIPRWRMELRLA
jgi:hypothetical protein